MANDGQRGLRAANWGRQPPFHGVGPVALVSARPSDACGDLEASSELRGGLVVAQRGNCTFTAKAAAAAAAGAAGLLVVNNDTSCFWMAPDFNVTAAVSSAAAAIVVAAVTSDVGEALLATRGGLLRADFIGLRDWKVDPGAALGLAAIACSVIAAAAWWAGLEHASSLTTAPSPASLERSAVGLVHSSERGSGALSGCPRFLFAFFRLWSGRGGQGGCGSAACGHASVVAWSAARAEFAGVDCVGKGEVRGRGCWCSPSCSIAGPVLPLSEGPREGGPSSARRARTRGCGEAPQRLTTPSDAPVTGACRDGGDAPDAEHVSVSLRHIGLFVLCATSFMFVAYALNPFVVFVVFTAIFAYGAGVSAFVVGRAVLGAVAPPLASCRRHLRCPAPCAGEMLVTAADAAAALVAAGLVVLWLCSRRADPSLSSASLPRLRAPRALQVILLTPHCSGLNCTASHCLSGLPLRASDIVRHSVASVTASLVASSLRSLASRRRRWPSQLVCLSATHSRRSSTMRYSLINLILRAQIGCVGMGRAGCPWCRAYRYRLAERVAS